jgi:hypothetical protein
MRDVTRTVFPMERSGKHVYAETNSRNNWKSCIYCAVVAAGL